MARLDVEYTEKTFKFRKENEELIRDKNLTIFSHIEQMTKEYGYDDTNDFLLSLGTDIKLPSKTDYIVLQDEKENTKAKLRIQASRTRY